MIIFKNIVIIISQIVDDFKAFGKKMPNFSDIPENKCCVIVFLCADDNWCVNTAITDSFPGN